MSEANAEKLFWKTLSEIQGFRFVNCYGQSYIRTKEGYCPICAVAKQLNPLDTRIELTNGTLAGGILGLSEEFIREVMDAADDDPNSDMKIRERILTTIGLTHQ